MPKQWWVWGGVRTVCDLYDISRLNVLDKFLAYPIFSSCQL